jgi:putative cell wall-binding protein
MRRGAVLLALLVVATVLAPSGGGSAAAQSSTAVPITRSAGANRIATAVQVARDHWTGSGTVLLATAGDFPDALVASSIAAQKGAPLLLTPGNALPAEVGAEIDRLGAGEVIVLGGGGAVSEGVVKQVEELRGRPRVERISGRGRFETAAAIARRAGAPARQAVVASGVGFADAVSAAALAAGPDRLPILLATRDGLPDVSLQALRDLAVERVYVVGGPGVVGPAVEARLREEFQVTRIAGSGRYETSVEVVREAIGRFDAAAKLPLVVATGRDFPDALAAGALAGRLDGPLLLVPPGTLPSTTTGLLAERADRWERAVIVGGTGAVSEAVREEIRTTTNDPPPPSGVEGTVTVGGDPREVALGAGQVRRFGVPAQAGTWLDLAVITGRLIDDRPQDATMTVRLLRPDGSQLWSWVLGPTTRYQRSVQIPTSGTYVLTLTSNESSRGDVTLWASTAVTGTISPTDAAGTRVTLSRPGQTARLRLTGTRDQLVDVAAVRASFDEQTPQTAHYFVDLVNPDGTRRAGNNTNTGNDLQFTTSLPIDATYEVVVRPMRAAVGTAEIWVSSPVRGAIAYGQQRDVSISRPGQSIRLSFTGERDDAIRAVAENTVPFRGVDGGTGRFHLIVLNPDETQRTSWNAASGGTVTRDTTLPIAGTYHLVVHTRAVLDPIAASGTVRFTLSRQ